MRFPLAVLGGACAVALLVWAALAGSEWRDGREKLQEAAKPLALFTSLPIYWPEARDVTELLEGSAGHHWARVALEQRWELRPLDTLTGPGGLSPGGRLLMVQPRPLTPEENVALDEWLAAGGRLLLFADPALTATSGFPLGDRRRPQDVALLSPILARWGLELTYDDTQPLVGQTIPLAGGAGLPIRLSGSFRLLPQGSRGECRLSHEAVIVRCRIGAGHLVAVADAALFEPAMDEADERRRGGALEMLTESAFAERRENTGPA